MSFTIKVKHMTNAPISLSVTAEHTVSQIKELITEQLQISAAEQKLIFKGNEFSNLIRKNS